MICIKTVQARYTKSSLWAAARILVHREKISCSWVRGFPSNEGVKEEYPLKDVILLLLARIVCKRLRINTDMLLIITSTGHGLFSLINIDDLKRPQIPKRGILVSFSQFLAAVHISRVNCDEMPEDRPRQLNLRTKFSALNAACSSPRLASTP